MFQVNGTTITMSRGDTGSVTFRATGYTFGAEDRALFTVKSPEGTIVKQSAYPIDAEGVFTVLSLGAALGVFNHNARRNMTDTHASLNLIDILTARTRRTECVPFEVGRVDVDFDVVIN